MSDPVESESVEAKKYWGSTDAQQKEYKKPPFYVRSLVHVIKSLAPQAVLEMGCNAGRNLQLLRETLAAETELRGFDINRESVEFGKSKWNLDLELADEDYLARQATSSVDILFTVSVLDHLPHIEATLADIARITRGYYIAVEPFQEETLDYLEVFKRDERIRKTVTTTTPYSYLHPYRELLPRAGFVPRLDVPMPPYSGNWGPLYRLTVYEKSRPLLARANALLGKAGVSIGQRNSDWQRLRDELMFDAVRSAK